MAGTIRDAADAGPKATAIDADEMREPGTNPRTMRVPDVA